MKHLAGSLTVVAMALAMLTGCGDDKNHTDDFSLNGTFTIVMSGSESGEPFESVGIMFLSTSGNVVTGNWRFDDNPVSIISGTVSGQISGSEFDFALNPEVPATYCGTVYAGRALVTSVKEFTGDYGGGCFGQEVTANFVANHAGL